MRRYWWIAPVAVLALAALWAILWPLTNALASHDVSGYAAASRAGHLQSAREAARTQLLTLGAGLFAAGALVYTARNFTLARQQFELARKSAQDSTEAERRTLELTEQGQVTDRYTKAIEQLGSDKMDVRIGGIYALERIAHDSGRDHPTVMEVLCAFVREHSREQWPPAEPDGESPQHTTRPDVQAALTVIGRRDSERDTRPVDLSRSFLALAWLTLANLTGVNLDRANLAGANLSDSDLTQASLHDADLTGAFLLGANLAGASFWGANLSSAELRGANLTGARFWQANLGGANLQNANVTGTEFGDGGANLLGADLTDALWPFGEPVPQGWLSEGFPPVLRRADSS